MRTLLQFLATHGPESTQMSIQNYIERSEALNAKTAALNEFQSNYIRAMRSNDPQLIRQVLAAGEKASSLYQKETMGAMSQLKYKLEQLESGNKNSPRI